MKNPCHRIDQSADYPDLLFYHGDLSLPNGTSPETLIITKTGKENPEHKKVRAPEYSSSNDARIMGTLPDCLKHGTMSEIIRISKKIGGAGLTAAQHLAVYRRLAGMVRPPITIVEADERGMEKLFASWFSDRLPSEYHPHPRVTPYLAKNHGEILGFIQLTRNQNENSSKAEFWLVGLMVRIPYRGMHIGEELSRCAIGKAQEEGADEIFLVVDEKNQPATALYRKLKFEPVSIPDLDAELEEEFNTTGRRLVLMHLVLKNAGSGKSG
jgi:ribosomal protein S18 acetylase RimI-like enzyme